MDIKQVESGAQCRTDKKPKNEKTHGGESLQQRTLHMLQWLLYAIIVGIAVGACGFGFDKILELAAEYRAEHGWTLYLLPAAGIAIVALYRGLGVTLPRGTNRILEAAEKGEEVAFRVAPMIAIATSLTHFCGGSAGREGAALQLGGSIANFIGRLGGRLKLGRPDLRIISMCGMAAGFSALFGTPLTSAVFALEVTNNVIQYAALLPCMLSAVIARMTASALGAEAVAFDLAAVPDLEPLVLAKVLLLGVAVAMLAIALVEAMEKSGELYARFFRNQYARAAAGAVLVIGLTLLEGSGDYNGAGMHIINRALSGNAVWYAFAPKIVFTALTLGAGFKGGEIVPTLFAGATFGCAVAPLLGLDAGFCAAFCMVGLFCGVTNCPLASVFLAYELFGGRGLVLMGIGCAVSYLMSGHYSLYTAQNISFSKMRID